MKLLIIEDEIKTARELKRQVESLGDEVLAIIPSVESGIKWFQGNEAPDLILSDIQLADGLSFEIYKNVTVKAPVIFCTAFDEYAIRAFEANGIDYLLKPIDEARLQLSLDKFQKMKDLFSRDTVGPAGAGYEEKLDELIAQLGRRKYKSALLIHYQDKIIPFKTSDIGFIYYENGLVSGYANSNKKYIINQTLDELEAVLDPRQFFRANRQFIINRDSITNVEHYFSRRLTIKLNSPVPEPIIISKIKSSEFLRWIEQ